MRRILVSLALSFGILGSPGAGLLAQRATVAQEFYVIKAFNPELQRIGVLISAGSAERMREKLARASLAAQLKAIVVTVNGLNELARAFRRLVDEFKVGFIWIPSDDPIVTSGTARKYLLKNAVLKGVGTCVPSPDWLAAGGTLYIGLENGRVRPQYNQRVLQALGLSVPEKYLSISTATAE